MKKSNFIFYFMLLAFIYKGQNNCDSEFMKDTLFVPKEGKVLEGEYVQTTLKNQSIVQLFKMNDNKFYLKLYVTENFYFNKIDVLEIKSGKKSYYAKETKQFKINKTTGMFVIEVFKNYLITLKEEGITSIVFGGAETDFTKQDASQIKKISKCFYESAFIKK